jgi:hypothetical protein
MPRSGVANAALKLGEAAEYFVLLDPVLLEAI